MRIARRPDRAIDAGHYLVEEAPDLARRLAAGGREYVLSNYTWDRVLDGVEEGLMTWTTP